MTTTHPLRHVLPIGAGVLVGLVLLACVHLTPPAPPPTATCADVCVHLFDLGCPAAAPTPEGTSCATVCENIQSSGVVRWDLTCMARAASCEAADGCN